MIKGQVHDTSIPNFEHTILWSIIVVVLCVLVGFEYLQDQHTNIMRYCINQ